MEYYLKTGSVTPLSQGACGTAIGQPVLGVFQLLLTALGLGQQLPQLTYGEKRAAGAASFQQKLNTAQVVTLCSCLKGQLQWLNFCLISSSDPDSVSS